MTDEEKRDLEELKASKMWRALRLASRSRLGMFDKLDDGRNLKCLVEEQIPERNEIEGVTDGVGNPEVRVTAVEAESRMEQTQEDDKLRPLPASEARMDEAVVK